MYFALYFLRLFNEDFGFSGQIMQAFFRDREQQDVFPYLHTFLLTILVHHRKDVRVNELLRAGPQRTTEASAGWRQVLEELCLDPTVADYVLNLKMPLRFYGGGTHTILGYHHWDFANFFGPFNREADFIGDLGGGFATADVSAAAGGVPMVCFDIQSPNPYDSDANNLLIRQKSVGLAKCLMGSAREEYIERQAQVPWIAWDALGSTSFLEIIGERASYGFISTGFLTSTVRPVNEEGWISTRQYHEVTNLTSLRIMELVALGKDVSLFTSGRPSSQPITFACVACAGKTAN